MRDFYAGLYLVADENSLISCVNIGCLHHARTGVHLCLLSLHEDSLRHGADGHRKTGAHFLRRFPLFPEALYYVAGALTG